MAIGMFFGRTRPKDTKVNKAMRLATAVATAGLSTKLLGTFFG
jgi:hypothetical protein